ncbi:MAG: hypothetical protein JWP89_203 [Schlesneria sp.]|nr:hypothetical protein [Schlesneria sp.]
MNLAILLVVPAFILAAFGLSYAQACRRLPSPQACDPDAKRLNWSVVADYLKQGRGTLVIFPWTQPVTLYVWVDGSFSSDSAAIDAVYDRDGQAFATLPSFLCYCSTQWLRHKYKRGKIVVCWRHKPTEK